MRRVEKYKLFPDASTLEMPKGAEILNVQLDGDQVFVYALVEPQAPTERRHFLSGTIEATFPGKDDARLKYIGFVKLTWTVCHIFEAFPVDHCLPTQG